MGDLYHPIPLVLMKRLYRLRLLGVSFGLGDDRLSTTTPFDDRGTAFCLHQIRWRYQAIIKPAGGVMAKTS